MVGVAGLVGLSADSWVSWDEEATYATVAAYNSASESSLFLSDGLIAQRIPKIPPDIAAAHEDVARLYQGRQVVEGPMGFAVPYEGLETILLHCFGEINTWAAEPSGTFQRYFDLSDSGRFNDANSPSLSVHVARGVVGSGNTSPTIFTYRGCVVDTFEFSLADNESHLQFTPNFFGSRETAAVSAIAATFPTEEIVNGTQCTATWGGVEFYVEDFTLTVANNVDKTRFRAGNTRSEQPTPGKRRVECTLTTEWDGEVRVSGQTMYADHTARTPRALQFDFTSGTNITGTSTPSRFILEMNQAVITEYPTNMEEGRDKISIKFVGYDSGITTAPHGLRLQSRTATTFAE